MATGPAKGDFVAPPDIEERDERADALPAQEEFWRPPVRFGSVPVEKEPLGWDRRRGFRKLFPQVTLPFQVAERVAFGHPELEPNRPLLGRQPARDAPAAQREAGYIEQLHFHLTWPGGSPTKDRWASFKSHRSRYRA